jgi:hypothetical protein
MNNKIGLITGCLSLTLLIAGVGSALAYFYFISSIISDILFGTIAFLVVVWLMALAVRQIKLANAAGRIHYDENGFLPVVSHRHPLKFWKIEYYNLNLVGAHYKIGQSISFEDRNISALHLIARKGGTQPNAILDKMTSGPENAFAELPASIEELNQSPDNVPAIILDARKQMRTQASL